MKRFRNLVSSQGKSSTRRNARPTTDRRLRLGFELLEDRRVMAVDLPPLADIEPGSTSSSPNQLVRSGDNIFFNARSSEFGAELWRTDGTASGTTIVKDIRLGPNDSQPLYLTDVNGTLFFTAFDSTNGTELWKSDGTAAGTVLVKNIRAGNASSSPQNLRALNGILLFTADDGIHGRELWRSDGTEAGTYMLKDIQLGASSSGIFSTLVVGNTMYFNANDGSTGSELWKTDGTSVGTTLVKDVWPGSSSSGATPVASINGQVFFVAAGETTDRELWITDGTDEGTSLVKDIRPGTASSNLSDFAVLGNDLLFRANDGLSNAELWKSDGTTAGTILLKDIVPGSQGSNPRSLTNVGGTVFFRANTAATGYELWKTDGTSSGTVLVADIATGAAGSGPDQFTNVNGTAYFVANDGISGVELWKTDGTAVGTVLVQNIAVGGTASSPGSLLVANGKLLFAATTATYGRELYALPLPSAPTSLILSPSSINENLPIGTEVGNFSSLDPNPNDTFTYSFATGAGDADNASFVLDGDTLRSAAIFDFETKSSYSIRVRTTDSTGLFFEQAFTINVTDVDELPPTVVSVSPSLASGVIAAGPTSIEITFSEPVIGGNVSSNFKLIRTGPDGLLGTADDHENWTTAVYAGTTTTLSLPSLTDGNYRLRIEDAVTDLIGNSLDGDANGVAGGSWFADFVVVGGSGASLAGVSTDKDGNFPADLSHLFTELGHGQSGGRSISYDGRFVVFQSNADDLVANDTNSTDDIFRKDNATGEIVRVSVTTSGQQHSNQSRGASISGDGRFVVFVADGNGLVSGDTNNASDVFLRDMETGVLTRVSTASDGTQANGHSNYATISADGTHVLFGSTAKNLISGDTSTTAGLFVKNLTTGVVERITVYPTGAPPDAAAISGDGRYVVFSSTATNLVAGDTNAKRDVFVKDRQTGVVTRVSTDSNGAQANDGAWDYPTISRDGRFVVFVSSSSNLVAGDTNGLTDVFMKDLQTGVTTRVSATAAGIQGNSFVGGSASISDDGRYIAFTSRATNLAAGALAGTSNLYVKDVLTGEVQLASRLANGQPFENSLLPVISGDGRFITLMSDQKLLNDDNSGTDIFVVSNPFSGITGTSAITLLSPNGFVFDVDAALSGTGQLLQGTDNAFDGLNQLYVDGAPYQTRDSQYSILLDGGRTVRTPAITLSDLTVSREVTVPSLGAEDFARTIDSFTNPTTATIATTVKVIGNLGSDRATTVFATSDGDTTPEPTDTWFGTDDADGSGSPAIIHLLRSSDGLQPINIEVIGDNIVWEYSLTIPAGQTRRLAHFTVLGMSQAAAIAAAETLAADVNFSTGAGVFLTEAEKWSLANFRVNGAPSNLLLSATTVDENLPVDSVIGTFTSTDPNFGDTFTYSLVSGQGDADNASFTIDGDELLTAESFDFETKSSYSIRVRTTDAAGLSFDRTLVIQITDVNDAPNIGNVIAATAINQPVNLTLSGSDDENDPLTFRITKQPTNGAFVGSGSNWTYTPNADFSGLDEFYYVANDGLADSFERRGEITVLAGKPIVSMMLSELTVNEAIGSATVSAQISFTLPVDLLIPVAVTGTASLDVDYTIGELVIPAGQTSGSLNLRIIDDNSYEPTAETIQVRLLATSLVDVSPADATVVTIEDNDNQPVLSFANSARFITERDAFQTVSVFLSAESQQPITVPLVFGGSATRGDDYTAPNSIVIPAGSRVASFTINIIDDVVPEGSESVVVSFGAVDGATQVENSRFTLFIEANDAPEVTFATSYLLVDEGIGTVTLTATLAQPAFNELIVGYDVGGSASLGAGGDYLLPSPRAFVFAPGTRVATQTLTIIDDDVAGEPDESIVIHFQSSPNYQFGRDRYKIIRLVDNDRIEVSLSQQTVVVSESAGTVTVTAVLNKAAGQAINVPYRISTGHALPVGHVAPQVPVALSPGQMGEAVWGRDFQIGSLSGAFQFAAGMTTASITVGIINDTETENTERFVVSLGRANGVTLGANTTTNVVIRDNDPVLSVTASQQSINEIGGAQFTYTFTLSSPTDVPVTASYTVSGTARPGIDFVRPTSSTITIPAGQTSASVVMSVIHDIADEDDETVTVRLGTISNANRSRTSDTATVKIIDNDGLPTVAFNSLSFNRGKPVFRRLTGLTTSLSETNTKGTVYFVNLTGATNRDVQVRIGFSGTTTAFYSTSGLSNGWLTIPAGKTSASFTIRPINNRIYHGDQNLTIRVIDIRNAATTGRTESMTVRIVDDEKKPGPAIRPRASTITNPGQLLIPTAESMANNNPSFVFASVSPGPSVPVITNNRPRQPGSLILPPFAHNGSGSNGLLDSALVYLDSNLNGVQDFLDLNGNGIQDAGEPDELATETELDGSFAIFIDSEFDLDGDGEIGSSEGRWVLKGGIDSSTGEGWKIDLRAPVGFNAINPLTTLSESLVRSQSLSAIDAIARTADALGIPGYPVATSNPLYATTLGDGTAARAYQELLKVSNAVIQISELLVGVSLNSLSIQLIADRIFDNIAARISEAGSSIDLSLAPVIESVVNSASRQIGLTVSAEILAVASEVISASSTKIDSLRLTDFPNGLDYATLLTKIKSVAQNEAGDVLRALGAGTISSSSVLEEFTGLSLDAKIALKPTGVILPPVVGVGNASVIEGNSGTVMLSFVVSLVGDHDDPISVSYRTADDSATVEDGDYLATQGILTWAAHDNSNRIVNVVVNSDTVFESAETVRLQLFDSVGAVIRIQEGYGLILNDDAFTHVAGSGTDQNQIQLVLSSELAELNEGGFTAWEGEFNARIVGTVMGADAIPDVLTVDFSANSIRNDAITFFGGDGDVTDTVRFAAGEFERVHYSIDESNSAATYFFHVSSTEPLTVMSHGVEESELLVSALDTLIVSLPFDVSEVIVTDADPDNPGTMKIKMVPDTYTPLVFTNPTSLIQFVFANPDGVLNVNSRDPDFLGTITSATQSTSLSNQTIAEAQPIGSAIGTFSSVGGEFTYSLVPGSGSADNASFVIDRDQLKTAASFDYEEKANYSIRVRSTDASGLFFEQTFEINVTDVDEIAPTAVIQPLPLSWNSGNIDLQVTLNDPAGPGGEIVSGVASYDVFVAIDNGPWTLWMDDVPAAQTELTYQAEPDRRYWFRAVATDVAGNVEADPGLAEANTRVLDFAAPVTQVDALTFTAVEGEIIVNFSGVDVGSSGLRTFQLWVSVDGGAATQVVGSPIPAGTATGGIHSGSVVYQGVRDGQQHSYRFYTVGVDARGNVESVPASGFDREVVRTFAPVPLAATGIDVQGGQTQRSFINQVDVLFNDASGVASLVAGNRIRVERFATNAMNVEPGAGTAVAGFTAAANANSIRLGFGASGIGGARNAGDGFYRVSIDMDGNGQFDDNAHFEFFRLFGDANGSGAVNSADQALTTIDINGDGRADTRDRLDIRSALGRRVDAALLAMIDD